MEGQESQLQSSDESAASARMSDEKGQEIAPEKPADDVVRRDTHQRALKDAKMFRERAQKAEALIKDLESKALEEQQEYKALYERTKQELASERESKSGIMRDAALVPALVEAGLPREDVDLALAAGKTDLLVETDSGLDGIEEYVSDLKARKPRLFVSQVPSSVNTSVPSGGLNAEGKKLTAAEIAELPTEQRIAALVEIAKRQGG